MSAHWPNLERLHPETFIFPKYEPLEEVVHTAFHLQCELEDAQAHGVMHARPICNGLVLTTCN